MNDKFFKLGRLATIWCCDNLNPDTSKEEWDAEWEDKFAELIVRACAGVVEDSVWHLPRGYKAKDQAEFVRKHFGVKE